MERVYGWLSAAGYPRGGIDWLRRRRLVMNILFGVMTWLPVIGLFWLVRLLIVK